MSDPDQPHRPPKSERQQHITAHDLQEGLQAIAMVIICAVMTNWLGRLPWSIRDGQERSEIASGAGALEGKVV